MTATNTRPALIVVDVQNDFCEGGSLAVTGGSAVAGRIAELVTARPSEFSCIVATADWHIDPSSHWSDQPDFSTTWPVHCKVGTSGADFHPAFAAVQDSVDVTFRKGLYHAAYSGFEGVDDAGITLGRWLRERGVDEVHVCGLATDYCVRATALDARRRNFAATVLLDLVAGVAESSTTEAMGDFEAAGVEVA